MLLSKCVLSNTDVDDKEQIQVVMDAEYDDNIIEYLMKYLELESYEQLENFLRYSHISIYN
jgi:hypothetical protein